jgi:hypothetical protein
MADLNDPQHVDAEQARAGVTPHMTRYILGISLIIIIAVYAFLMLR